MHRSKSIALAFLAPAALATTQSRDFPAPPLHPRGAELETRELAPAVYALVSTKPPVDNVGFVVGERGVLVVDSHINGEMAGKILAAVRAVTEKPILYLVNTNYHGDHTFGNDAFPSETRVVAHRHTASRMAAFENEKRFLLGAVESDPEVFAGVTLRLPDVVFEEYLRLDLGGRVVELHHFGGGNTAGDTVVYVPEARVAWTGNLVVGEGTIPWLLEGGRGRYLETIARFATALDVETIVPGHGDLTTGAQLGRYLDYLSDLGDTIRAARAAGRTLEETLESSPLPDRFALPPDSPLVPLMAGFHRWNLSTSWREVSGAAR